MTRPRTLCLWDARGRALQGILFARTVKHKCACTSVDTARTSFTAAIIQCPLCNTHSKFDIYTNIEAAFISISRPLSILESCYFALDTDLDTYFVKISRQYRYDIDISAFLAIPTSISISNQSVSHITAKQPFPAGGSGPR